MRKAFIVLALVAVLIITVLPFSIASAGGAQSFYPLTPAEVTVSAAGSWVDVDLSASLPAGATGAILHIVETGDVASAGAALGVRKNGSTDNRIQNISGGRHTWLTMGVDANRILEIYSGNTTSVDVYLVGYTSTGVTFFTNAYDKSLASYDSWLDIDCSVEAPNAIGLIFEVVGSGTTLATGLRNNGSSDTWNYKNTYHNGFGAIIGCDSSQIVEGYADSSYVDFFLVGYVTTGATFYTNTVNVVPSSTDAWLDIVTLPSHSVMGFFQVGSSPYSNSYGIRENGSAENLIYSTYRHPWAIVECDGSGIIEGYVTAGVYGSFAAIGLVGYASESINAPIVTTLPATYVAKTSARLNGLVSDDGDEPSDVWFQYYKSGGAYPGNTTSVQLDKTTGQTFNADISGLDSNTTYYFRAVIQNTNSTQYGNSTSFKTGLIIPDITSFMAIPRVNTASIDLKWANPIGATSVIILGKLGEFPGNITDGTLVCNASQTSAFKHEGLVAGSTWYYSAWGMSGNETSDNAAHTIGTVSLVAPGGGTNVPGMPTNWFRDVMYTNLDEAPGYGIFIWVADSFGFSREFFFMAIGLTICILAFIAAYVVSKGNLITAGLAALVIMSVEVPVGIMAGFLPFLWAFVTGTYIVLKARS